MRALWIFGIAALLIFGCTQVMGPTMSYSVKVCDASRDAVPGFKINSSEGVTTIHQVQNYVCCAEIGMSMVTDGKTIRIYEENIKDMCKCICPFEADIELQNVEGYERVEIYGVKYRDIQDYGLLFNSTIPG